MMEFLLVSFVPLEIVLTAIGQHFLSLCIDCGLPADFISPSKEVTLTHTLILASPSIM